MFAYLKGVLVDKEEDALIVDIGGVGYRVLCPKGIIFSANLNTEIMLFTYTYIREDAFALYGFIKKDDLNLFKLLISVSGIGPRIALGILSVMDSNDVRMAVLNQDNKLLSSAPGIGAKTASRIILELKDKIALEDVLQTNNIEAQVNDKVLILRNEAYEALVGLGVNNIKANQLLSTIEIHENSKIEDIIKVLLSKL